MTGRAAPAVRVVAAATAVELAALAVWSLADPVGLVERFRSTGGDGRTPYMVSEYSVLWRAFATGSFASGASVAARVALIPERAGAVAGPLASALGLAGVVMAHAVWVGHRFAPLLALAALCLVQAAALLAVARRAG